MGLGDLSELAHRRLGKGWQLRMQGNRRIIYLTRRFDRLING